MDSARKTDKKKSAQGITPHRHIEIKRKKRALYELLHRVIILHLKQLRGYPEELAEFDRATEALRQLRKCEKYARSKRQEEFDQEKYQKQLVDFDWKNRKRKRIEERLCSIRKGSRLQKTSRLTTDGYSPSAGSERTNAADTSVWFPLLSRQGPCIVRAQVHGGHISSPGNPKN